MKRILRKLSNLLFVVVIFLVVIGLGFLGLVKFPLYGYAILGLGSVLTLYILFKKAEPTAFVWDEEEKAYKKVVAD